MTSSHSRRARVAEEKARRKLEREPVVLDFPYDANGLQFHGPIIETNLTISPAQADALLQASQPVPPPVRCRFLIDTGADGSVVKHEIAEKAGLKLIQDSMPIHGVGIDTTGRVYMGRITFAYQSKVVASAIHQMAIDTQIMSAKLDNPKFDGLIGRDVLRHFQLSYDGKTGVVRMKYYKPE